MAFSRSEETALIQSLYTCASQTGCGAWQVFLNRLANMTRADLAMVIVEAEGQKTVSVSAQNEPEWISEVVGPSDPLGLNRLRNERVYSQEDLPECDRMLRIAKAQTSEGAAWLMIHREREDFRALDAALLSFLMPHLGSAVGIWCGLGRNSLDSQLKQRLTESLDCGWIAFDRAGRVIDLDAYSNDAAIRVDADLIRNVVETETPQSLAVDHFDIHLTPFTTDLSPSQSPIACIGLIRDTNPEAQPSSETITQTLDIAKSEARLATCLAQGLTLSECADHLGLTIETTRNYSKRIFAQTGLKGQPDLVRRVLNGVGRFR